MSLPRKIKGKEIESPAKLSCNKGSKTLTTQELQTAYQQSPKILNTVGFDEYYSALILKKIIKNNNITVKRNKAAYESYTELVAWILSTSTKEDIRYYTATFEFIYRITLEKANTEYKKY